MMGHIVPVYVHIEHIAYQYDRYIR